MAGPRNSNLEYRVLHYSRLCAGSFNVGIALLMTYTLFAVWQYPHVERSFLVMGRYAPVLATGAVITILALVYPSNWRRRYAQVFNAGLALVAILLWPMFPNEPLNEQEMWELRFLLMCGSLSFGALALEGYLNGEASTEDARS